MLDANAQSVCEVVAFRKLQLHICIVVKLCFVAQFSTVATILQTLLLAAVLLCCSSLYFLNYSVFVISAYPVKLYQNINIYI